MGRTHASHTSLVPAVELWSQRPSLSPLPTSLAPSRRIFFSLREFFFLKGLYEGVYKINRARFIRHGQAADLSGWQGMIFCSRLLMAFATTKQECENALL